MFSVCEWRLALWLVRFRSCRDDDRASSSLVSRVGACRCGFGDGHMGYSEDWLSATFKQGTQWIRLSLDLFDGGPLQLDSEGLSEEEHRGLVEGVAAALARGA